MACAIIKTKPRRSKRQVVACLRCQLLRDWPHFPVAPSLAIMEAPPKDYAVVFQRTLQAVVEEEEDEHNDDPDVVFYVLIFVLVLVSIFIFLCWRFQHSRYLRGHQVTDIAAHLEERRRALEEKNFVPPEKRKEQLLSSFARNNVTMVR
jgi:hypothetical protein